MNDKLKLFFSDLAFDTVSSLRSGKSEFFNSNRDKFLGAMGAIGQIDPALYAECKNWFNQCIVNCL